MLYAIERFNQYAVKNNLSAGAILLWQYLYFTMSRKGVFTDVTQNTSVLTARLDVTRQGLQMMRQTLVDKGFLSIRQDEHQQIFYTLLLNGKTLNPDGGTLSGNSGANAPAAGKSTSAFFCTEAHPQNTTLSDAAKQALREPLAEPKCADIIAEAVLVQSAPNSINPLAEGQLSCMNGCSMVAPVPSGDIILTNQYKPYIDQFCDRFGVAMRTELLQWAEMRRKNGWTLTLWGLEALLKKLIALAGGSAVVMAEIVKQSVKRRWKGFFELKVKPQPSGAKLVKLEEKQQKQYQKSWEKPSPMQKFKPEGRDLSFLER